jgi:hypothetical protein
MGGDCSSTSAANRAIWSGSEFSKGRLASLTFDTASATESALRVLVFQEQVTFIT